MADLIACLHVADIVNAAVPGVVNHPARRFLDMRTILGVCGAIAISAALVGAQDKQASGNNSNTGSNNAAAATTVTFTGCLNSGSSRETFYLTKAKQKGTKTSDKSLKIVPGDKVSLSRFVTNEVELTGTVDPAEPPAEAAADGAQQVRTLTVTKVKIRGESCG
jgi:hypothetical protein